MDEVRRDARALAGSINRAGDLDVSHSVLLPELITILQEAGFTVPSFPGLGRLIGR